MLNTEPLNGLAAIAKQSMRGVQQRCSKYVMFQIKAYATEHAYALAYSELYHTNFLPKKVATAKKNSVMVGSFPNNSFVLAHGSQRKEVARPFEIQGVVVLRGC